MTNKNKKRALAITCLLLMLTMVFTASASSVASEKEYYNWSYDIAYADSTAYELGIDEPFYPCIYGTQKDSNDNANRVYWLQFQTSVDGILSDATLNQLDTEKTIGDDSVWKRDGYVTIGYELFEEQAIDGVKLYDPQTDFAYTKASVYFHFKFNELSYADATTVRRVSTQLPTEAGNRTIRGFAFGDAVGEVETITEVVFWDSDSFTYKNIETSQTLNVETYTNEEHDHWQNGYDIGYGEGYNKGLADGIERGQEWDLYSLISAIFDAPFQFVERALDFDIFGFNVADFVRMVIGFGVLGLLVYVIVRLAT